MFPAHILYISIFCHQLVSWSSQNKACCHDLGLAGDICLLCFNVRVNPRTSADLETPLALSRSRTESPKTFHGLTKLTNPHGAKTPKMAGLSRNFTEDNVDNVTRLCKRDQDAILSREKNQDKKDFCQVCDRKWKFCKWLSFDLSRSQCWWHMNL